MSNRAGRFAPGRQQTQRLLHPFAYVFRQRPGSYLSNTQPEIGGLAAHPVFDSRESADPAGASVVVGDAWMEWIS
jgi:hypothetical protein